MENKIEAKNLDLYYGEKHALKNVSLDIKTNKIISSKTYCHILSPSIHHKAELRLLSGLPVVVNQHF